LVVQGTVAQGGGVGWSAALSIAAESLPMSTTFYDELAPFYHLLYPDWDAAVRKQGAGLTRLLQARGISSGSKVLDAACGIGTQALGLAANGYSVEASDISSGEISRLKNEAASRGVDIAARVDDLRTLSCCVPDSFDAVLACDNSVPHLLSDSDLLQAFRSSLRVLRSNGLAVYSVRDYANIERKNPDVRPYGLRIEGQNRFLAVQAWEWDGDQYDLRMYLTQESPGGACSTRVFVTRYYAVTIDRLLELMARAGFVSLERLDDVLFQPIILGRKPSH
jgi:SAM-dependent methyltransferase